VIGVISTTIIVAEELHRRGYAIEYFAPSTAKAYAPKFAKFFGLTREGDTRFDRYTKVFCHLWSHGDSVNEASEYTNKEFPSAIEAEFGVTHEELLGSDVFGVPENFIHLRK